MLNFIKKWRICFVTAWTVGLLTSNSLLADERIRVDGLDDILSDAVRILPPGGKTIGGPGEFELQDGDRVNVIQLFDGLEASNMCITIFCKQGTCNVTSSAGGGGFLSVQKEETLTGCTGEKVRIEIKCQNGPCRGVWRVDNF